MKDRNIKVEYVDINDIKEWDKNPRRNDKAVNKLAKLIKNYGFIDPIVVTPDMVIRAGHTRVKAAKKLGITRVPVVKVKFSSEQEAIGYAIADNKSNEFAEWDNELLDDLLEDLSLGGFDLEFTGFTEEQFTETVSSKIQLPSKPSSEMLYRTVITEEEEEEEDDGEMLDLVNVFIKDPTLKVSQGDVWKLGNHILVCEDVMEGWERWIHHLEPGCILAPYPGPFVPVCKVAEVRKIVMIQPDTYIAGHILDRYKKIKGEVYKQ